MLNWAFVKTLPGWLKKLNLAPIAKPGFKKHWQKFDTNLKTWRFLKQIDSTAFADPKQQVNWQMTFNS